VAEPRTPTSRHGLSSESSLLGHGPPEGEPAYDARASVLDMPAERPREQAPADLRDLRELIPAAEPGRELDDWGRSERVFDAFEPVLDFYYRHWFRVETEGIENVPGDGGALLVSNHAGALPPDGPMILQAIRREHPSPRPLYMLGEHWFKGYPGVSMLVNKLGLVAAHPANAQRLLHDEGQLVLVFPEGQKGSRKVFWQRYHLRRFGRGGFVRTAMRAGAPIVPIAVIGAEEQAPAINVKPLARLLGAPSFPVVPYPPFLPLVPLPVKYRLYFGEPIRMTGDPDDDDEVLDEKARSVKNRIQSMIQIGLREREHVFW
jgi:1-acyl-sn-glycerol-3-phosphate acyltransferase